MEQLVENTHFVVGKQGAADIYAGNPTSDAVKLSDYQQATFLLQQKTAGTNTGTATITLEACSAADGTGAEAVAFDVYKNEAVASSDVFGARTAVAAAGFSTTANKDALYACVVRGIDLPRGKPWVRLKATETVNDPVDGSILIAVSSGPKAAPEKQPTVIA